MRRGYLGLNLHLLDAFQLGDDFVNSRALLHIHLPAPLKQRPHQVRLRAILLECRIVGALGCLAGGDRGRDVPLRIDLVVRLETSDQLREGGL